MAAYDRLTSEGSLIIVAGNKALNHEWQFYAFVADQDGDLIYRLKIVIIQEMEAAKIPKSEVDEMKQELAKPCYDEATNEACEDVLDLYNNVRAKYKALELRNITIITKKCQIFAVQEEEIPASDWLHETPKYQDDEKANDDNDDNDDEHDEDDDLAKPDAEEPLLKKQKTK